MKKTPFYKNVLNNIIAYFTSLKFFFRKEFIAELYWKHLLFSFLLSLLPFALLLVYCQLEDTPMLFQIFINGLCCYVVNWLREAYKEDTAKKKGLKYPFDIVDVYFGSYGGIIAVPFVHLVLLIINLIK